MTHKADVFLVIQKDGDDFIVIDHSVKVVGEEKLLVRQDNFLDVLDLGIRSLGAERIEESKINIAARDFNEIRWDDEHKTLCFYLSGNGKEGQKASQDIFRNRDGHLVEVASVFPPNYKDGMFFEITPLTKMLTAEEEVTQKDMSEMVFIASPFTKEEERIFSTSAWVSTEIENLSSNLDLLPESILEMEDTQEAHLHAKFDSANYSHETYYGTEYEEEVDFLEPIVEFHPMGTYQKPNQEQPIVDSPTM